MPLLAALLERPDDRARYLAYAEALARRGEPRGELIARQARGEDAREFLAAHPDLDLPPQPPLPEAWDPAVTAPADGVEWFCGFWRSLHVWRFQMRDVEPVIAHPSARL